MKKNLLSILILALLVVNLVMTSIMMFSVTGAMNKTSSLVTDIASVLKLELGTNTEDGTEDSITIADTEVYDIADSMTITLLPGDDGKTHYYLVAVSLSINNKNKDYKKLQPEIEKKESIIKSTINEVISGYTYEEAVQDQKGMKQKILTAIQDLFGSDFIYEVNFREYTIS